MQRPSPHQVVEHLVRINSNDRDTLNYPSSSDYVVRLGRVYRNVVGLGVFDAGVERRDVVPDGTFVYRLDGHQHTVVDVPGGSFESPQAWIDALQLLLPDLVLTLEPGRNARLTVEAAVPFSIDTKATTIASRLGLDTSRPWTPTGSSYSAPHPVEIVPAYVIIESDDAKHDQPPRQDPGLAVVRFDDGAQSMPIVREYNTTYFDAIKDKLASIHIRIRRPDGELYDGNATNWTLLRIFVLNERLVALK